MTADIPVRIILDAIDNASNTLKGIAGEMETFGSTARKAGLGMAAVGAATVFFAKSAIEQAGAMEQNRIAFETMLGSAQKARNLLSEMSDFAQRTPFNLPDIVTAGKQLLAYGFAQQEVIKTTEMLGNVAAGLNIPLGDIIYLFGTLRAQGRAYTKDLNQFTARGIPILDNLAKQYGVTTSEVFKLAETGKIGFKDVETAFQGMTNKGGQFFNLMDKQSKSTLGVWSNLQDSITRVQIALGDALLPAVNEAMKAIMPFIKQFNEWAKQNPELIKNLVIAGLAIGALGVTLGTLGVIFGPIIATFQLFLGVISGIVTLVGAAAGPISFIAGLLGGPLTIAILALIAAGTLLTTAWRNNWFDIQGKVQEAGVLIGEAITTVKTFLTDLWNYVLILPTVFTQFVESLKVGMYVFFTETLPFAIGFLAGVLVKFVTVDVPAFINSVILWFSQLPPRITAFLIQVKDAVITYFTQSKDNAIKATTSLVVSVLDWISTLPGSISSWLSKLPGIVSQWFNDAKNQAVQIARDMYEGVKVWFEKVINFFKDIVNWASQAISKANEAASAGFKAGKRQFGGPVSAFSPVMVGEAGPEMFIPQTAGRVIPAHETSRGGGGTTVQFIINSDMIINSPTERRSIAEALYKDLVMLARSQDMTVAQMLGG